MKTFNQLFEGMNPRTNDSPIIIEARELTKDQERELAKTSKLPVNMRASGGFKLQASVHAQARASQRRDDITAEGWKAFGKKMARYVETNKIKKGTFMFHDVKGNQSVVASVKGKQIDIVTVFPQGTGGRISAKQQAAGQLQAMMEAFYEQEQTMDWLEEAYELTQEEAEVVLL